MKISLNWLRKYVEIPVTDEELVRLIGARLVEVEGVIDETHKYDNIYVVRVESAEHIPDTHLTLCRINPGQALLGHGVGSARRYGRAAPSTSAVASGDPQNEPASGFIQVVCGAPNVREGMLAVWIAPGAVVPASVHEDAPFVIGKRKMRGYESCGMLAGADELDFGDDHSGIVEIDPSVAQPGDLLAEVFELKDLILDIENKSLTHRPDCFGVIGFAREVAGVLGRQFDAGRVLSEPIFSDAGLEKSRTSYAGRPGEPSPAETNLSASSGIYVHNFSNHFMYPKKQVSATRPISIKISDVNICPRYSALILEKHGELKKKYLTWEDTILAKAGMRPVDPIVDATNYLMLLTGQPLHAFDYDKFLAAGGSKKPEIVVRLAKPGEKLTLLDDKEVELNENDIVICSGEAPVALAGAMGGKSTAIDENTRKIILESATFSLYNLRKTQMAHGIFSEAITRFTKGQPAYQTLSVAEACAEMLAGGFKVTGAVDKYPKPAENAKITVTVDEINGLLGTDYSDKLITETLQNVGFQVAAAPRRGAGATSGTSDDDGASGTSDDAGVSGAGVLEITSPEWRTDIHIKEDVIEEVGRLNGYDNIVPTLPLHGTAGHSEMWELKKRIRRTLARFGANEVLTYSFVSGKLLEKVGQDAKNSYKIVNSISPELQYVRQSITPSLLDKAYLNEKLPVEKFAIFEMNKVYRKAWGMDAEKVPMERMQLGFVVAERKNKETAFYKAKWYAAKLLEELNFSVEFLPMQGDTASAFEPKRSVEIWIGDKCVGGVGELKNSVRHEFKLAPYVAGFELDLDWILAAIPKKKQIDFAAKKTEDITITTDKTYAEELKKLQEKHPNAKITPGTIYQAEGQTTKNMTFHLEI